MATIKKACKGTSYPKSSNVSKRLGSPSKAKNGKSFPDLNKDGKITKADILKGRGVIAKKGMKVKKAQDGDGVFAPMTLNKDQSNKLKNTIKQRKASADSSIADFNRRLKEAKAKGKQKPKAKTGAKMTKKCMYGCK